MIKHPELHTRWMHNNGNEYVIVMLTNFASKDTTKYPPTIVYVGTNGYTWSRPLSDWYRSFTPLD